MQKEKLFMPSKHNNVICAVNQVNRNKIRASTLGTPNCTYTLIFRSYLTENTVSARH